jgi:hypothetical protein
MLAMTAHIHKNMTRSLTLRRSTSLLANLLVSAHAQVREAIGLCVDLTLIDCGKGNNQQRISID